MFQKICIIIAYCQKDQSIHYYFYLKGKNKENVYSLNGENSQDGAAMKSGAGDSIWISQVGGRIQAMSPAATYSGSWIRYGGASTQSGHSIWYAGNANGS